jgi:adenylate cyclase
MRKKRLGLDLLIPFAVAAAFCLANLVNLYRGAEWRIYDQLLHLKPAVPEDRSLLFLEIDDTAIAKVGSFPWSRDLMADGLILMKEMGASYAVFDIEYVDRGPRGVDARVLEQEVPELFGSEFDNIKKNIRDLFQALRRGSIGLADAQDYIRQLEQLTDSSRQMLLDKVGEVARDNDAYLADAARLFGRAFFTLHMLEEPQPNVSEELRRYVLDKEALPRVQVAKGFPFVSKGILPAVLPILEGSRGAGFVNAPIDGDGVRRRIDLVTGYGGRFFAQLGFAALLDWMGWPEVDVEARRIILKDAEVPGKGSRDVVIPLDENRRFLINWPKATYQKSFRHLTYWELVRCRRLELNLVHNLDVMKEKGYLAEFKANYELLAPYEYAERVLREALASGDAQGTEEYRQARETFLQDVGGFLEGPAEANLVSRIDALLASGSLKAQDRAVYLQVKKEVPGDFAATREVYRELTLCRGLLKEQLAGSFCLLGWTGTSTTDMGANPFQGDYMNLGTHAAVVNTILSGRFLDSLPWWISAVAALGLALAVYFIVRRLKPLLSILIGLAFLLAVAALGVGFFLATGSYLNLLTPVLSVFFTLFVLILVKFLEEEKQRIWIRNAFTHYLSADVIKELEADPEKLNLGGERKYLTALFTDVRGFSTISEQLNDPKRLVNLLNAYLEEMSNIILDLRGTIDKYEGDAIIAFFGAPLEMPDHAQRACASAVRMKKMESILNEHVLREKLSPAPLATRVGINTGEMVVGNMGTKKRMDYTIMGSSVNLAARLEGVNKQYGTWILASEITRKEAGEGFAWREMDRVRVVGMDQPVRLYELLDESSAIDPATREALGIFQRGKDLYESRQWEQAAAQFEQVRRLLPGDGPSEVFLKRCREFQRNTPEGFPVFRLTLK